MKLHSSSWVLAPVILFILVWISSVSSQSAAESLVETGLLTTKDSAFLHLPGSHGAGVGVFSTVIYVGVGLVVGPIVSLFSALDFVWDDKNMVRVGSGQDKGDEEKDVVSMED